MAGRRRGKFNRSYKQIVRKVNPEFINPYPWMSDAEAMVHLELERRHIPFSWRYFDGTSPWLQELIPDYAPEFTLREQKLVIIVVGEYFGSLPGVLDRQALAQAALEEDGWKVATLFGETVKQEGADAVLNKEAPELRRPVARGNPRKSPYDPPTYLEELRRRTSAFALKRSKFALDEEQRPQREERNGTRTRVRPKRKPARPRNSRRRTRREGSA